MVATRCNGDDWDNWGLDDIVINATPASTATWTLDFGEGDVENYFCYCLYTFNNKTLSDK